MIQQVGLSSSNSDLKYQQIIGDTVENILNKHTNKLYIIDNGSKDNTIDTVMSIEGNIEILELEEKYLNIEIVQYGIS